MSVVHDGDSLYPVVPAVHFLTGKPLDRLKDGNSVVYASLLSLYTYSQSTPKREAKSRFVVSYAIWEDNFQVTIPGSSSRTKSGLSPAQAEAWCLENMAISSAGISPDAPFNLRLEIRADLRRDVSGALADPGISIPRLLVDVFSPKPGPDNPRWGPYETGPIRLSDLAPAPGRGARKG